jgi:hypothetical protein
LGKKPLRVPPRWYQHHLPALNANIANHPASQYALRIPNLLEPTMAIGKKAGATNDLINEWKNLRAADALEKYWSEKTSPASEFSQPDAIEQILYDLERYESALRRIAAQPGPSAEIAQKTLAYKRPDWR